MGRHWPLRHSRHGKPEAEGARPASLWKACAGVPETTVVELTLLRTMRWVGDNQTLAEIGARTEDGILIEPAGLRWERRNGGPQMPRGG